MKKVILVLLALAMPIQASNDWYSIKFSDDVQKDCNQRFEINGCIYESSGEIIIKSGMSFRKTQTTIAHEIGHWYMRGITREKYIEVFEVNGSLAELKEVAAISFSNWYFQRNIRIDKSYIKGYFTDEVYDIEGNHIAYKFAVENNIWSDIQEIPVYIPNKVNKFFEEIILN